MPKVGRLSGEWFLSGRFFPPDSSGSTAHTLGTRRSSASPARAGRVPGSTAPDEGESPMTVMASPSTLLYAARRGPRPMSAEDLWAIPRVGTPVFSPDGGALAVTVTSYDMEKNEGRGRIWLVQIRGGEPLALTSP